MSEEKTCGDTSKCTCSPGSGAGALRCEWQDGKMADQCGPEAARASRSASPGGAAAQMTLGTCGLTCSGSSESAALTESLASRLRARLVTDGSTEYAQTWRELTTPLGRVYWGHTASPRRTSGRDCGGWPTPRVDEPGPAELAEGKPQLADWPTPDVRAHHAQGAGMNTEAHSMQLGALATTVTGWPTPNAANADRGGFATEEGLRKRMESGHQKNLQDVVGVADWCTPNAMDGENVDGASRFNRNSLPLNAEVQVVTGAPSGSPAQTGPRGVLNPAFPLWLMGYPEAWATCAPGYQSWVTVQDALSKTPSGSAREPCAGQATQ
jgi:hypothetical protein